VGRRFTLFDSAATVRDRYRRKPLPAHFENIGMTATEWGKLIGIDCSTAFRLIRGERKFNTAHVRKTTEALNLEASLLI
jgi:predicted transcriptional regulator